MSTFLSRIQDYVGTYADTTALDDWLTACAKKIVDIIPAHKVDIYSTEGTDLGTGLDIEAMRFIRAHKSGYGARVVSPSMKARYLDSDSIHYATSTDPIVYIENGKAYVKPNGGTVVKIAYPTVLNTDTTVADFPDTMEHALVLYAVIQALNTKIRDEIANVSALTFTDPTVPTAPSAPSFTYTDASGTTVTATEIDITTDLDGVTSLTQPTYTKPTVTLTTAPTSLTISATAPTAPAAPTISYVDASGTTVSATTIDISLLTPPSYTKPTISLSSAPTDFDFTIAVAIPTAPSAPSFTYTDATLGTYTRAEVGSLGTAPTYTKPTTSATFTDLETYIGTDEDLEKASLEVQNQNARLQNYQMDLYNELNEFNKELEEYKSTVQKAIEQARLDQQRILQQGSETLQLNLQNEAQTTATQIKEYESKLGKYQSEINAYQALVNKEVTKYSTNLQKWIQQRNTELNQYQLDIQNELNEFNEDLRNYEILVENKNNNAQLLQQKLIDDAQRADNIALQNEIQTLQAAVADYQGEISRYSTQIQSYGQEVNAEVSQFASNLEKWGKQTSNELQQYQLDIQNELNEYNKDLQNYLTKVQNKTQNAQLLQQKLLDDAQRTDQIAMQNRVKQLEEQISEYIQKLGLYQSEIASYSAQVNKESQEYSIKVQAYANNVNLIKAQIEEVREEYNSLLQAFVSS